jgi:carbamoyl-phosphate synthase large subunit
MEHIEEAGIHSGDSSCVLPAFSVGSEQLQTVADYTVRLALALRVIGLMNAQYAIQNGKVYVLEVNPRASRTVPYVSKATGVPLAKLASRLMTGRKLRDFSLPLEDVPGTAAGGRAGPLLGCLPVKQSCVKSPVFPFSKFPGVDPILGPEMKSTGEVMGVDHTFEAALAKALQAADTALPPSGAILLSLADQTKSDAMPLVRNLAAAGYRLYATTGTAQMVRAMGLPVEQVPKRIEEGHPNVVDVIHDGLVNVVINTPEGRITETLRDGFDIRRAAAEKRIPCLTSIDTANAAISVLVNGARDYTIQPLRDYLR